MSGAAALPNAAVAVIDALGFKGIWKKHDPLKLLQMLVALRKAATDVVGWGNSLIHENVRVTAVLFSDTILVTAMAKDGATASDGELIGCLVTDVMKLTTMALTLDPPLAYRGTIAFGPLVAEHDVFIGPAIDEAAEWADRADAAVVWLCPSALATLGTPKPGSTTERNLVPWRVPLKPSGFRDTYAVNVLCAGKYPGCVEAAAWDEVSVLRGGALARFAESTDPLVAVKKQNTEAFLVAAEAHSRAWWRKYRLRS